MLQTASRGRRFGPLLFCLGAFLLCVALIWPVLESGLTDDWSTVRTAQLLAQTGHIHYNGWEAAMLGWPLYVGALIARLFGPSFASIRLSDLLESLVTIALIYRTFLRSGLNSWNASFGVLTVALTPMYLLASVIFMTDVPGLLAVMVCFYSCLRALQATAGKHAAGWIAVAALSNAILGTSRQIAWLGVLLMVPCTVWLRRRVRPVVVTGVVCCAISYLFVVACIHWFNHQPYILVAPLLAGPLGDTRPFKITAIALRTALDLLFFLLPVVFAFLPAFRRSNRRTFVTLAVLLIVGVVTARQLQHISTLRNWLVPFLIFPYVHPQTVENTFTMTTMPAKGHAGLDLDLLVEPRVVITWMVLAGIATLAAAFTANRRPLPRESAMPVSMRQLLWLTLPTVAVYLAFLISRGTYNFVYDRYLLPVLPLLVLLLLRVYQSREGVRIPALPSAFLVVMAAYGVVTLHDVFATYRGALAACDEVLAAGYPRTAMDGGWEYNHYTQIVAGTYVHQAGVRLPDGTLLPNADTNSSTDCSMDVREWTPDLHPLFMLGFPGTPCKPATEFAPVQFHTWLPPHVRTIDVFHYSLEGPVRPQPAEK